MHHVRRATSTWKSRAWNVRAPLQKVRKPLAAYICFLADSAESAESERPRLADQGGGAAVLTKSVFRTFSS